MFDVSKSDLTGVDRATLQQWLGDAQQALHDLTVGGKPESVSYAQGEGSRAVTYTRADVGKISAYIALLKAALGISRGRRPVRFFYS